MSKEEHMKQLNHELTDLLNTEIKDQKSILGISISTHGGTHIVSELKEDIHMINSTLPAPTLSALKRTIIWVEPQTRR